MFDRWTCHQESSSGNIHHEAKGSRPCPKTQPGVGGWSPGRSECWEMTGELSHGFIRDPRSGKAFVLLFITVALIITITKRGRQGQRSQDCSTGSQRAMWKCLRIRNGATCAQLIWARNVSPCSEEEIICSDSQRRKQAGPESNQPQLHHFLEVACCDHKWLISHGASTKYHCSNKTILDEWERRKFIASQ